MEKDNSREWFIKQLLILASFIKMSQIKGYQESEEGFGKLVALGAKIHEGKFDVSECTSAQFQDVIDVLIPTVLMVGATKGITELWEQYQKLFPQIIICDANSPAEAAALLQVLTGDITGEA